MYFYVIQTVFKLFKNHKNQRSQIVLNFILKILQSAKSQTGLIFFHLKIAQLYIIMYFYVIQTVFKLFKNHKNQRSQIVLNFILKILQSAKKQLKPNHLKIIKSKIADYVGFHIENLQSAKINRIYFFTSKQLSIYNYVFLCYLDCFQII